MRWPGRHIGFRHLNCCSAVARWYDKTLNGAQAPGSPLLSFSSSLKFNKFEYIHLGNFWKKKDDVGNISLYHSVNFQMTKRHHLFYALFFRWQNLNLCFLLSPKYNIFRSKKLHTSRIQHYLQHDIFFKDWNSNFWTSNFGLHGARAWDVQSPFWHVYFPPEAG
jgi:hypothetical protein